MQQELQLSLAVCKDPNSKTLFFFKGSVLFIQFLCSDFFNVDAVSGKSLGIKESANKQSITQRSVELG